MQGVGEFRTGAVATELTWNGMLENLTKRNRGFQSAAIHVSSVATAPVLFSSTHSLTVCMHF